MWLYPYLLFLVQTNIRENVVMSAPHTCEVSSVGPGLPTTQRPSLCQSADKTTPRYFYHNITVIVVINEMAADTQN